jgi:putative Mg2+ transporter-C (MgtC) family protein
MPSGGPSGEALLLLRLLAAVGLAAALGWERERARKPAGLRTHMLVGLAASLYAVLATLTLHERTGDPSLRGDPVRVIQAVALGVGFLGGGVISAGRAHGRVSGLTTAASIWATAAMGVAAGLGYYVIAVGTTALQLIVLRVVGRWEREVKHKRAESP